MTVGDAELNMIAVILFKFLEVLCRLLRSYVPWLLVSLPALASALQALGLDP